VSKYRAVPTIVDGIRFASKKEARRYRELKLLEKAGEIKDLELQKKYSLLVAGSKVGVYIADFVYQEKGNDFLTVEDVKGVRTPVYRLKKKIFEAMYRIEIRET